MNYNKVILAGFLTRDPDLRHTQSGTAVASFGLAVNRKWSQNGETRESVCFVDIKAWGKTAEVLNQYVKKGDPLFVEGRLEFESWEKDGEKRSKLFVTADAFQFVGGKRDDSGSAPAKAAKKPRREEPREPMNWHGQDGDYSEIPF